MREQEGKKRKREKNRGSGECCSIGGAKRGHRKSRRNARENVRLGSRIRGQRSCLKTPAVTLQQPD